MNKFSFLSLLPILGQVFSKARKHAETAGHLGLMSKDTLAEFIEEEMKPFNPKVEGDEVLHQEEKHELSRALAGIILHIIGAERKHAESARHLEGRKP